MLEQDFIDSCKRANPKVFEAETIKLRVDHLESLLRKAYRAGKKNTEKDSSLLFESIFTGGFANGKEKTLWK